MNIPHSRDPLQKGLGEAAIEGFSIKFKKRRNYFIFTASIYVITTIACPLSAMIAIKAAFISVGWPPLYRN
jgi:hypothetical protein